MITALKRSYAIETGHIDFSLQTVPAGENPLNERELNIDELNLLISEAHAIRAQIQLAATMGLSPDSDNGIGAMMKSVNAMVGAASLLKQSRNLPKEQRVGQSQAIRALTAKISSELQSADKGLANAPKAAQLDLIRKGLATSAKTLGQILPQKTIKGATFTRRAQVRTNRKTTPSVARQLAAAKARHVSLHAGAKVEAPNARMANAIKTTPASAKQLAVSKARQPQLQTTTGTAAPTARTAAAAQVTTITALANVAKANPTSDARSANVSSLQQAAKTPSGEIKSATPSISSPETAKIIPLQPVMAREIAAVAPAVVTPSIQNISSQPVAQHNPVMAHASPPAAKETAASMITQATAAISQSSPATATAGLQAAILPAVAVVVIKSEIAVAATPVQPSLATIHPAKPTDLQPIDRLQKAPDAVIAPALPPTPRTPDQTNLKTGNPPPALAHPAGEPVLLKPAIHAPPTENRGEKPVMPIGKTVDVAPSTNLSLRGEAGNNPSSNKQAQTDGKAKEPSRLDQIAEKMENIAKNDPNYKTNPEYADLAKQLKVESEKLPVKELFDACKGKSCPCGICKPLISTVLRMASNAMTKPLRIFSRPQAPAPNPS